MILCDGTRNAVTIFFFGEGGVTMHPLPTMHVVCVLATITHNASESWYKKLQEMADLQQRQQIWMSEKKVCL
jgi:hypothetical protein